MPPSTAVQENRRRTDGRKIAIKPTAIRLREPAIATGFQSIDLMRTPPSDQNKAVRSKRATFLFKRFETKRCVVAAEAEGVVQCNSYLFLACDIWHIVQVAFGVWVVEIDRGRYDSMFHGQDTNRAFHCSGAAKQMADHRFCRANQETVLSIISGEPFNGIRFAKIADRSRRSMSIDVFDIGRIGAGSFSGDLHGSSYWAPIWFRRRHMIGIAGEPITGQFAVDPCSSGSGVFVLLEYQDPATFAHDETIAFPIEWARCPFRLIVLGAHSPHRAKAADPEIVDDRLCTAGQENFSLVVTDHSPGFADGIGGGRASRHNRVIRTFKAVFHGDQTASHVHDHHRNHEWRDSGSAFL